MGYSFSFYFYCYNGYWSQFKIYKNYLLRVTSHMQEYNQLQCPKCSQMFAASFDLSQFMLHIKQCKDNVNKQEQQKDQVYEKVPIDFSFTKFRWEKKPKIQQKNDLHNKGVAQVRKLCFQEKQIWLRKKLESLRIPWTAGADYMRINKSNILMSSLVESQKVNMHKQVKIEFEGEKVNDAGGLLREWIHMITKQLFDFNTGIFTIANTQDIMYRLKWDQETDEYFSEPLLTLFGVIIAKSIFERIPLTCYLDRTILRQICNGSVKMQDIYGFDTQLYKNWKFVEQAENVDDLDTYFVTYHNNGGTMKEYELLEGHKQIKVDNQNKFLYLELSMQFHTSIQVKRSLRHIKTGIQNVFPSQWLSIFEPYEMQMLLYGIPFIDLQDWFDNTEYKAPYNRDHHIIKWFWQAMEEFNQQQLARILHFCTGSTRTPIHGFKKLESNRGNYSKFLIVSVAFEKQNPYPKGHTCFNRLQLPNYSHFQELKTYLTAIANNELDGIFGLD